MSGMSVRWLAGCVLAAWVSVGLQADEWLRPVIAADAAVSSDWSGTVRDDRVRFRGKPTQRWEHSRGLTVVLKSAPSDWSTRTHVRFWMYSHVNTRTHFVLHLAADDPATDGMDYYHRRIPVNFTGWREIVLPVKQLGPARKPLPLNRITRVSFFAEGWDNRPDRRTVLNFSSVELGDFKQTMMSNAELFDALDWSTPGLQDARGAWTRRDEPETVRRVAAYFRNRTSVPWRFDPHDRTQKFPFNRKAADQTVRGSVSVVCVPYTFPNGKIDWLYNHTKARPELPDNNEWQWQLNRMGFWTNLGRTYRMTGDETYARAFVSQFRDWTAQCLDPRSHAGNGAGSAWRTIECGIRLSGPWPEAYHLFLHSPSFTDEDLLRFIRSSVEQMRHLVAFPQTGNWLTMEMNGVYTCASLFPELKEAAAARAFAVRKIDKEIKTQFLPDGGQFELTPGYHQVAMENIMAIPRMAQQFGRMDELPGDFVARMERAYAFNLKLMTPDGNLPKYNDSWGVGVRASLRSALSFFPEREDFRYVATGGREGRVPSFGSVFLPWSGYAAMRSSWDDDAVYVGFDAGPLGYGHVHQDKLNVVLYAGADELIFDDGGGSYESSPFRRYATGAHGHNTVLVDGLGQSRSPRDPAHKVLKAPLTVPWESTSASDYISAVYSDGYGKPDHKPAVHTRQVLFIKPSIVLVCDFLESRDGRAHTWEQRWQVNDPSVSSCLPGHPALWSAGTGGRRKVVVAPLLTDGLTAFHASAQTSPAVLGWYVIKDAGPYRPATTACFTKQGKTARFLTLLMPLEAGAPCPVTAIRQTSPDGADVMFRDGRTLMITLPETPSERLNYILK